MPNFITVRISKALLLSMLCHASPLPHPPPFLLWVPPSEGNTSPGSISPSGIPLLGPHIPGMVSGHSKVQGPQTSQVRSHFNFPRHAVATCVSCEGVKSRETPTFWAHSVLWARAGTRGLHRGGWSLASSESGTWENLDSKYQPGVTGRQEWQEVKKKKKKTLKNKN